MTRRPLLEACLIVRDEAVDLPGCLRSLRALGNLLGAIRVYDTGSTDSTIALAREFGCDVQEGYWDDDFARARNASLEMSEAHWALVIDADERVIAMPERLRSTLERAGGANVLTTELFHVDVEGRPSWRSRYLKMVRPDEIRFHHPIHEVVGATDGKDVRILDLDPTELEFEHLGYADPEDMARKADRNHAIADAAVRAARARGDRHLLAHALRHRARSTSGSERIDATVSDLREAWGLLATGTTSWVRCGTDLVHALQGAGSVLHAGSVVDQLIAGGAPRALGHRLQAELALDAGRLGDARRAIDELLAASEGSDELATAALALRLRLALAAQERDVALAVAALLVNRGDESRVPILVDLFRGSATMLTDLLTPALQGPHSDATLQALRDAGGLGESVATLWARR